MKGITMAKYDLENLKFDTAGVNTELAQEYLKKNMEIHAFGPAITPECHNSDYELDLCDIKVFYACWKGVKICHRPGRINSEKLSKIFIALAKKIKENEELLYQLEYMTRKTPIDEVKGCHIQLIIQQLLYWSSEIVRNWDSNICTYPDCGVLDMDETIPLLKLGSIVTMLLDYNHVIIRTTKETAALCYLFMQLCHDVGLQNYLSVGFVKEHYYKRDMINKCVGDVDSGSWGVVTARADMDSAVDAFLAFKSTSPWKLKRILIQENVLETFKKAIQWKCDLSATIVGTDQELSSIRAACTDVYIYGDKVFAVESSSNELPDAPSNLHLIAVEAYRTTKELMSLAAERDPFYVCLWSSDGAEANEIALGLTASVVWVNNSPIFTGPPKASQAIYSKFSQKPILRFVDAEFVEIARNWSTLDNDKRREIVCGALDDYILERSDDGLAKRLQNSLLRSEFENFVEVRDGTMCIGLVRPIGAILMSDENYFINAVKSAVQGNSIVYPKECTNTEEYKNMLGIIQAFKTANVPITHVCENTADNMIAFEVSDALNFFRTKVIWTNFGTVFAN